MQYDTVITKENRKQLCVSGSSPIVAPVQSKTHISPHTAQFTASAENHAVVAKVQGKVSAPCGNIGRACKSRLLLDSLIRTKCKAKSSGKTSHINNCGNPPQTVFLFTAITFQ